MKYIIPFPTKAKIILAFTNNLKKKYLCLKSVLEMSGDYEVCYNIYSNSL